MNKIFARKCELRVIPKNEERKFLIENHSQKYYHSDVALGLYFNEELVFLMTFGKPRFKKDFQIEIIRLASKKGYSISGGASKVFSYFLKNYNPQSIISYCDKKYFSGKVYEILGMKLSHTSKPNYWYIKGEQKMNRIKCQKHKLHHILGKLFDPFKSEKENMIDAGYTIEYDLGNDVYVWKNNT